MLHSELLKVNNTVIHIHLTASPVVNIFQGTFSACDHCTFLHLHAIPPAVILVNLAVVEF